MIMWHCQKKKKKDKLVSHKFRYRRERFLSHVKSDNYINDKNCLNKEKLNLMGFCL